jgi:hypothetical protein
MRQWSEDNMQRVRDGDESFAEYRHEVWDHIDWLTAQLAACAAGPWRTDVENAPKGEWLMVLTATGWCKAILSNEWWYGENGCTVVSPLAFAVPNAPQVTT